MKNQPETCPGQPAWDSEWYSKTFSEMGESIAEIRRCILRMRGTLDDLARLCEPVESPGPMVEPRLEVVAGDGGRGEEL